MLFGRANFFTANAVQVRTYARHVPEAISWENQYVAPHIIEEPVIGDDHGRSLIHLPGLAISSKLMHGLAGCAGARGGNCRSCEAEGATLCPPSSSLS